MSMENFYDFTSCLPEDIHLVLANQILQQISGESCVHIANIPYEYNPGVIDALIEATFSHKRHDFVVVMTSGESWYRASPLLKRLPRDAVLHIKKRNGRYCGKKKNELWIRYDREGLKGLGRRNICTSCSNKNFCSWFNQWGKLLHTAQIVILNHQILKDNPGILSYVANIKNSSLPLVIFEDADFCKLNFRHCLPLQDIDEGLQALERLFGESPSQILENFTGNIKSIISGSDLDNDSRPEKLPEEMQREIQNRFFEEQQRIFPFHGVHRFWLSDPVSRFRTPTGDISYYAPPVFVGTTLILGPVRSAPVLSHRFGIFATDITPVLPGDPGTVYYNLPMLEGTGKYRVSENNIKQITAAFAQLIFRIVQDGDRILLLCPSEKVEEFQKELQEQLELLMPASWPPERVLEFKGSIRFKLSFTDYPDACKEGATGAYQNFTTLICFYGYYHNNDHFIDLYTENNPDKSKTGIKVDIGGNPKRRIVTRQGRKDASGQSLLDLLELGAIQKAISSIRPAEYPRIVILMQCGQAATLSYEKEFYTLQSARRYFSVLKRMLIQRGKKLREVERLEKEGLSREKIANKLGVTERTISNWKKEQKGMSGNPVRRILDYK